MRSGPRRGRKYPPGVMTNASQPFAVVTGGSTGIGYELAKQCLNSGYDVLMVADEPAISAAADRLVTAGNQAEALQADLSTSEGVDKLYSALNGRPVDALLANAGRGLGHAFLDQDIEAAVAVIDTNITGTIYLIHKVGNDMRRRNAGKILITESIAGFISGSFQAVYNGTKAFLNSFFLYDPRRVEGYGGHGHVSDARRDLRGGDVVAGMKNKIQAAVANVTPAPILAKQHRKMAEPGSAKHKGAK
jgi:uncharacterized protein